jgi:hypothetical protein
MRLLRVRLLIPLAVAAGCDTTVHYGSVDASISSACLEAEEHSDFAWLRDKVFMPSCAAFSSCHQGSRPPANLNLTPSKAYAQLVGVPAISVDGWTRVVPGHPEMSYLLVKLGAIDGPLGDRGSTMPPNSALLCQQKRDAVSRWIAAGALGDEPDAAAPDAAPVPRADGGMPDAATAD